MHASSRRTPGSGDLVATSDRNRATFATAVINGLGAINFDGAGDSYALPSAVTNTDHLFVWVFQNLRQYKRIAYNLRAELRARDG